MINDLTTTFPRRPHERFHNIAALPRFFDKVRARANSKLGEYVLAANSELDRELAEFLNIDFDTFFAKPAVSKIDSTDEKLFAALSESAYFPEEPDIAAWSDKMEKMRLVDDPERQKYAKMAIEKGNLPPDITTFDWLVLGDK